MKRRRFGISLPEELACELDRISREHGLDRSSVIATAVEKYVEGMSHYKNRHECLGVCIAVTEGEPNLRLEEFREVVVGYYHNHAKGLCLNIFVLRGDSNKVLELYYKLKKSSKKTVLVPLH
ncbi:putative transcriptional regulator, CopG family [Thermogladius calderae 1633]|uniref:Putative transcriptional regulator, CopG family n=1 Tax=Thermogladius calderae (strain DSM 22663 / VKM B-2946 / 1633) TaxID=1184251 RepID=I3TE96_THEC1|nr:ribbon-helix-helix protein, CopG family [Thermogladius calderae]AFK51084.1 putative transcriptional regulator, CopG family [Thermogladius calderae 1633]